MSANLADSMGAWLDLMLLRGRFSRRLLLTCLLLSTLAAPLRALAQDTAGAGVDALPGVHEMPLASGLPQVIAARGGVSYGWTEAVLKMNDSHHRLQLDAAASLRPLPFLATALRVLGRYDAHQGTGASGSDYGIVTETHLTNRALFPLGERWHAGAELGLWLPAGDTVPHALSALSGDLSLLLGYAPVPELNLGLTLGMRMDRSRYAGGDPEHYSAADRLALGTSDDVWGSRQGLAVSYRIGQLECIAEWAYRMYFARPRQSPMWIRAGARYHAGDALALELLVGVSPSARPSLADGAKLFVVEPRLALGLALSYAWSQAAPPQAPSEPAPVAQTPTVALPPPTAAVRGQVLAASGAPLSAATVTLSKADQREHAETDAQGSFAVRGLPPGAWQLEVSAPDFSPSQQTLELQAGETQELRVELKPELPIGQIRGTVRRFDGRPIAATVTLRELSKVQACRADGTFELDVPPGEYTVVVTARGFAPQTRKAKVELRGVAILIVELEPGR